MDLARFFDNVCYQVLLPLEVKQILDIDSDMPDLPEHYQLLRHICRRQERISKDKGASDNRSCVMQGGRTPVQAPDANLRDARHLFSDGWRIRSSRAKQFLFLVIIRRQCHIHS